MFEFIKSAAGAAKTGANPEMPVPAAHYVNGNPLKGPFPDHMETAMFGMGCFWGVERLFWSITGVYSTAAGFAAGETEHPTYKEVCTGHTHHNEVVLVVYDPGVVSYDKLLKTFWESHNPTQGMRQGNDTGSQYRSGIYTYSPEQLAAAQASKSSYQAELEKSGNKDQITTEVMEAPVFYYAEEYHQQYLEKNPGGYCGLKGTGVSCAA